MHGGRWTCAAGGESIWFVPGCHRGEGRVTHLGLRSSTGLSRGRGVNGSRVAATSDRLDGYWAGSEAKRARRECWARNELGAGCFGIEKIAMSS